MKFKIMFIALISQLCVTSVFADLSEIKDAVMENCEKAETLFSNTADLNKVELVNYLSSVLELKLVNPKEVLPLAPAQMSQRSLDNVHQGSVDLWRSFDPKYESKAKSCAVNLLEKLTPESTQALANLVKLAGDNTLPIELKKEIDSTAKTIAAFSHAMPVSNKDIQAILQQVCVDCSNVVLAVNILEMLGQDVLQTTLQEYFENQRISHEMIRHLLLKLDPELSVVAPYIMHMLQDANQTKQQLAYESMQNLGCYYYEHLREVVSAPSDVVAVQEAQRTALTALSQLGVSGKCNAKELPCNEEGKRALSNLVSIIKGDKGLLRDSFSTLLIAPSLISCLDINTILSLLQTDSISSREEALHVLASYKSRVKNIKESEAIFSNVFPLIANSTPSLGNLVTEILIDPRLKIKANLIKALKDSKYADIRNETALLLYLRGEYSESDRKISEQYLKSIECGRVNSLAAIVAKEKNQQRKALVLRVKECHKV